MLVFICRPGAIIPLMGSEEISRIKRSSNDSLDAGEPGSDAEKSIAGAVKLPLATSTTPSLQTTSTTTETPHPTTKFLPNVHLGISHTFDEEEEEEKVFLPFLGFEVSKSVDNMFKKYMKHRDDGGQCMTSSILSVLEEGLDPEANTTFEDLIQPGNIVQKFTRSFYRR
jgi:hypothetical protein